MVMIWEWRMLSVFQYSRHIRHLHARGGAAHTEPWLRPTVLRVCDGPRGHHPPGPPPLPPVLRRHDSVRPRDGADQPTAHEYRDGHQLQVYKETLPQDSGAAQVQHLEVPVSVRGARGGRPAGWEVQSGQEDVPQDPDSRLQGTRSGGGQLRHARRRGAQDSPTQSGVPRKCGQRRL